MQILTDDTNKIMTIARKNQISPEDTPFYPLVTRCARRAFLCGKDKYSGNCYEHRRGMIKERIKNLTRSLALCGNAYS